MDQTQAHALLVQMLGMDAPFREGQWEAIDQVAQHGKRLLVVQRTGWGKSVVYFMAAKILRERGGGPTVLISPLLGLMRNQIEAAGRLGIRALAIHSENRDAWEETIRELHANRVDVLMISPERLANPAFGRNVMPLLKQRLGLFVVDEAHCISDWGHDFRPDYRRIVRILETLPPEVPVLCTTATANDRVVADVAAQIPGMEILRGSLVRKSLKLDAIRLGDQAERLAWLAHFLPKLPGSGIVYTLTVADAQRVADWLMKNGIEARCYFGGASAEEKIESEQLLLSNRIKALVATVALGMGFDKPDLGFVVHFQRPGSVVAYYQQVGRAGRAVEQAYGLLLSGREDDEIQEYFIQSAFPPAETVQQVLSALEEHGSMSARQLFAVCNLSYRKIEEVLKVLEVEGAVERDATRYARTAFQWHPDVERSAMVTANRRAELEQMRRYVEHDGCLMEFLQRALDDPDPSPCGKCARCVGSRRFAAPPPTELIGEATQFLRSASVTFEPRKQWPAAGLDEIHKAWPHAVSHGKTGAVKADIPEGLRAEPGVALCIYNDSGWGREVARAREQSGEFSDRLVVAAAALIRDRWKPRPMPQWVTAVPSLRRPAMVPDFARRLAECLGLPFHPLLKKVRENELQNTMENSYMQVRNLMGVFSMKPNLPSGPVLLVDDLFDSKWTMTVFAMQLRYRGAGPVLPFALAASAGAGA